MNILLEYSSRWGNSFLDGSNNKAIPPKGRKYIASGRGLKKSENFIKREITLNTIMGVLNRLIGDQRKLYQARQDENYYFKDIEERISFKDNPKFISKEVIYLRNISGNTDQKSFAGIINNKHKIFQSDYSKELWGVLFLNIDDIFSFILNINKKVTSYIETNYSIINPLDICFRFEELNSLKSINKQGIAEEVVNLLENKFPGISYVNNKEKINISSLYCSALYLQIERLSKRFDISTALTKKGNLSGISKKSFTKKDFMNNFTTGGKKYVWGNPYIIKEYKKGEGEIIHALKKVDGIVNIDIDINREKAKELKELIKKARVSTFYLGKKGLAYITCIDTREN